MNNDQDRTEQCAVCGAVGSLGRDGNYIDDGEGTVLFVHDSCAD